MFAHVCLNSARNLSAVFLVGWQAFATNARFNKKQSQAAMQFAAFVKVEYEAAGPQVTWGRRGHRDRSVFYNQYFKVINTLYLVLN